MDIDLFVENRGNKLKKRYCSLHFSLEKYKDEDDGECIRLNVGVDKDNEDYYPREIPILSINSNLVLHRHSIPIEWMGIFNLKFDKFPGVFFKRIARSDDDYLYSSEAEEDKCSGIQKRYDKPKKEELGIEVCAWVDEEFYIGIFIEDAQEKIYFHKVNVPLLVFTLPFKKIKFWFVLPKVERKDEI